MKNNFLKSFALLFVFAAATTSCTSDDGESINEGESTGNYLPLEVNNEWNYSDGTNILLSDEEEHDGHMYYMYSAVDDTYGIEASQGFRKSGATYYMYTDDLEINYAGGSITTEGFEFAVLKDDLEVGESITTDISYESETTIPDYGTTSVTVNATYTSTIVEFLDTLTVNGEEYTDVIKVKLLLSFNGENSSTYYYFGNNVGVLKWDSELGVSSNLTSYSLY
ncbi:hypothetical protein SAMN05216480_10754 [Pustulibacterium marinum]|uniref:Uncharacterized protein n=1 Tax=Pustulibacterium marinum TaxID=1224947 RepID=A0A1I7H4V7_9FLAO|nr:hypothetical protein [Pustulibacterium marinum]SFU55662.1 hypothetical protein SAMN05216480_10754 [Pustulibacterium marinum]